MKEQSHKNEMSAAIRGDFKRLRERGVAATLAPRDDDVPEPVEIVPEHDELVVTVLAAAPEEPDATPEAVEEDVPGDDEPVDAVLAAAPEEPDLAAEAVEEDEPGDTEPPGFFSRLFGR